MTTLANCEEYSLVFKLSDNTQAVKCVKCDSDSVPTYVTNDVANGFFTQHEFASGSDRIISIENRYAVPNTCELKLDNNKNRMIKGLLEFSTNEVKNCEWYHVMFDRVGCFKCKHGYSGRVHSYTDANGPTTHYYLEHCDPIPNCADNNQGNTKKNVSGSFHSGPLSMYMSCHECDANFTPVSFWAYSSAGALGNIIGLNIFNPTFAKDGGGGDTY